MGLLLNQSIQSYLHFHLLLHICMSYHLLHWLNLSYDSIVNFHLEFLYIEI